MATGLGVGTDDNELNFAHINFEVAVGYLSGSAERIISVIPKEKN